MKSISGVKDLLVFLKYLRDNGVWFRLDSVSSDAVMVTITLLGERIEVQFFEDHIEYSRFKGDEEVEEDVDVLFASIRRFIA